MKVFTLGSLLILTLMISGCGWRTKNTVGPGEVRSKEMINEAEFRTDFSIPAHWNILIADGQDYLRRAYLIDDTSSYSGLLQPIQVLYFTRDGQTRFHTMNSFIGGFPNLHWEKAIDTSSFPLELDPRIRGVQVFHTLNSYEEFVGTDLTYAPNSDVLVLQVNYFLWKQGKRLLELVKQYEAQKVKGGQLTIWVINTDDVFYEYEGLGKRE
ncbi:MAG: hypothetical protein LPK80_11070 [Bacteroidota bacterium]|nr:hypothetical protein [Bacteroidota bacterium]MDX5427090.1 hypothetical protein [Bacteroidota bacterium]MDX5505058.1 hypothetical protein [Bacteroidota bacterium]